MVEREITVREFLVLRKLFTGILEECLKGAVPEPDEVKAAPLGLTDAHFRWLMLLDLCAAPEALRQGIQRRHPDEESLIVLLHYLVRMGRTVDHDRFDWVLTYMFKRRLEDGAVQGFSSIGAQIMELFPDFPQPPLSSNAQDVIKKLNLVLEEVIGFTDFAQLTASGLLAKGRDLKEKLEAERYHPAVLATVVNYNLVTGKTFRTLFDESALRSRELAARLSTADYRSNVEHMHKVKAEAEPKEEAPPAPGMLKKGEAFAPTSPESVVRAVQDPIKELGLDDGRESQKLRFALRSLIAYFEIPEHRAENTVSLNNITLALADWETRALSTDYPSDDKSFRAEFARTLSTAAAHLFRVEEESDQLERKSSSEYLWKPHYDALIWLFARGRTYVETMKAFAGDVSKRGLPEKQQQVLKSAARLSEALDKVAHHFTVARGA